ELVARLRAEAEAALRRRPGRGSGEVVVRGTLRRAEVGTRPLVLDGDDGTTWELLLPPSWQVDVEEGARLTVMGERADDVHTTAMVGPVLRVRSLGAG
ncbi:MAG: hypothetical protein JWP82_1944, partial [Humibacillus sp.]|nr:hypothetical protein [Humibacillus sp.]